MWPPARAQNRISNSRLAKYGRIEDQAIQAGEEIKLLSRFVAAQRTAFVKLLKKYSKWTRRDILSQRFKFEVVDNPQSFIHTDLTWHLDCWTLLLNNVRQAMGQRRSVVGSPLIPPMIPKQSSSDVSKRINEAMLSNSDIEFDTVFTYSPLGSEGARAVYWIHPEQLVELQVLLLQHTRSAFSRPSTSNGPLTTGMFPQRGSISRRDSGFDRQLDHGILVLDDAERFAQKQNSIPISDTEEAYSRPQTQPAATLMWTANNESILCIANNFTQSTEHGFDTAARLKKKRLGSFLNLEKAFVPGSAGDTTPTSAPPHANTNTEEARKWLREHKQISPLVALISHRIRFASIPANQDHGQWVTLDTDVAFKKTVTDELSQKDWPQTITNDTIPFPYAVLEVRQEGRNESDLIKILDASHLTERVRGFSLAVQALWVCRRPRSMTPPFWLPVLSSDIRKLPSDGKPRTLRKSIVKPGGRIESGQETDGVETSVASSQGGDSSMASTLVDRSDAATRMRNVTYAGPIPPKRKKRRSITQKPVRYWSEYDHPEDGDEEGGYYIYVDPDAEDESMIPFKDTFSKLFGSVRKLFGREGKPENMQESDEFTPLLLPQVVLPKASLSDSLDDDDSTSSSSDEDENPFMNRYNTIFGGTASTQDPDNDAITTLLASSMSLFFSATLSLILLVLGEVGRHKAREEIDITTIAGSVISIVFGVGGFWGLVLRSRAGLSRWIVGLLAFGLIVLVNAITLARLASQLRNGVVDG